MNQSMSDSSAAFFCFASSSPRPAESASTVLRPPRTSSPTRIRTRTLPGGSVSATTSHPSLAQSSPHVLMYSASSGASPVVVAESETSSLPAAVQKVDQKRERTTDEASGDGDALALHETAVVRKVLGAGSAARCTGCPKPSVSATRDAGISINHADDRPEMSARAKHPAPPAPRHVDAQ